MVPPFADARGLKMPTTATLSPGLQLSTRSDSNTTSTAVHVCVHAGKQERKVTRCDGFIHVHGCAGCCVSGPLFAACQDLLVLNKSRSAGVCVCRHTG